MRSSESNDDSSFADIFNMPPPGGSRFARARCSVAPPDSFVRVKVYEYDSSCFGYEITTDKRPSGHHSPLPDYQPSAHTHPNPII